MDRISKLARPLATALVLVCLAVGCGKDEGGTPEPPSPPDPPKPAETVIETFKKTTVPGAYDLSSTSLKPIVSYIEGGNQYSFYTSSGNIWCGVIDMDKGAAFRAGVPTDMATGNEYTLVLNSTGSAALPQGSGNTLKVNCVKTAQALYWVVDDSKGIGFILARKEL